MLPRLLLPDIAGASNRTCDMRILLLAATISTAVLGVSNAVRSTEAASRAADPSSYEQARNELLTAEERLDVETRYAYLAGRKLTR